MDRLLQDLRYALRNVLHDAGLHHGCGIVARTRDRREHRRIQCLGALRPDVLALIMRRGLLLTAIGVVAGIPGAVLSTRLLQSLIDGITPADPGSYLIAAALLVTVATVAAFLSAHRTTAVDPPVTLREHTER